MEVELGFSAKNLRPENTIPLAPNATPSHSRAVMKFKNLFLSLLAFSPSLAVAHPGHGASALHLHVGGLDALNSVDPTIIAAGLLAGSLLLAFSLQKER
jgi:hypothetical protein